MQNRQRLLENCLRLLESWSNSDDNKLARRSVAAFVLHGRHVFTGCLGKDVVNRMKELVEVIAKSLVDHPEEVVVTQTDTEEGITLVLNVASEDMGKVIGKQGRIAKAIRTVVKAAASKDDTKVVVEIGQ